MGSDDGEGNDKEDAAGDMQKRARLVWRATVTTDGVVTWKLDGVSGARRQAQQRDKVRCGGSRSEDKFEVLAV
ncbi:hypothetical protein FALBO_3503 [Fusarium albosuccineum]|uniref:Uncharacterized protein n=1 Tax=Fusarium albosuccineum TaxID=1237068 RepID=A0A8H4LJN5_9HYPO|nr:hypothetical protein FALBO_3503 [Fusarium albosuccineum]